MFEILPFIGGLGAGLVMGRVASGRARWIAVVLAGAVVGSAVALVSGELASSFGFLLVDVPAGVVAAALGCVIADRAFAPRRT
ncbi:MAG TPA: hypothetical protein VF529_18230 [Solirubrobacteraceae bacterium]